jgi:hypothetical protein
MNYNHISIVIPIKEDSENLKELLANLKNFGFNDLHVVDSLEVRCNRETCKKNNAHYKVFNWDGKFPKKRNWYLETFDLREWVLFLDSDERVTEDFCTELLLLNENDLDGFYVKYNNTFLGRRLKFGDVMTKIPLIRNHIRFEKIDESGWSTFDMEIHEHPILDNARIGIINSRIEHLEKTSIEKYLKKHNNYSNWESKRLANQSNLVDLRFRTRVKYILLRSQLAGPLYFFYAYILKLGFLDGLPGFYLAKLKAQYFFWIRLKYHYETRIK